MIGTIPFSSCYLILTEDCNLRCKYCYENATRCNNSYMSFDVAKKSVDFLFDNALKHNINFLSWTFFGGEPLLNLDVMIKFFHYAVDKANQYNIKVSFSLLTNGTIYNKEYEQFILDWYKTTKQVNIQISIDGIPEVHDKNRITLDGKPTSKIVLENILKFKKFLKENLIENKFFKTHTVTIKDTIAKVFLSYKYLRQLGINDISFVPSYNEFWDEKDLSSYIEQLSFIADFVYDECVASSSLRPFENAHIIIGSKPTARICKTSCATGHSGCTIVPNGDIYPWERMYFANRNFKLGNVYDGIIYNNKKTFFDTCLGNTPVNNVTCVNCGNTECTIYMASNYLKYNKAKLDFIIETKKKFDKLSEKLNYNKCNEMSFLGTTKIFEETLI